MGSQIDESRAGQDQEDNYCSGFESLLESLENCVIKELDFHHYSDTVYGIFQTTRKVEVFAIEVPMERRNIRAS